MQRIIILNPKGGSGKIAEALARHFLSLGGEIVCGSMVDDIEELPAASAYLFDTGPRALAGIAGDRLRLWGALYALEE